MAIRSTAIIEQQMYEYLEGFMADKVSGGFYPSDCRPGNSTQEDAVLTVSYANASQIQAGRAKLNIYVPDIDCGSNRLVPNKARLQELTQLDEAVINTLNEADTDYLYYLSAATHTIGDPDIRQHFVNINIGFKLITF